MSTKKIIYFFSCYFKLYLHRFWWLSLIYSLLRDDKTYYFYYGVFGGISFAYCRFMLVLGKLLKLYTQTYSYELHWRQCLLEIEPADYR